jgi:hypothetical protein
MATNQQNADALLQIWQASRALTPDERMSILMRDFFRPVPPSDMEYAAQLAAVSAEMEAA